MIATDRHILQTILEFLMTSESTKRLIPLTKWNDFYEWPPYGGLRHIVFYRKTNGFATAVKHVGRRVLIDEQEFFKCVERMNGEGRGMGK